MRKTAVKTLRQTRINPVRARFNIAIGLISNASEASGVSFRNDDEKLIKLAMGAHGIGDDALLSMYSDGETQKEHLANLKYCLVKTGSYVASWLAVKGSTIADLVESTFAERRRQDELLRAGKIFFNCASPIADNRRKFRVLLEEIGEVAEAIDKIECASRHERANAEHHLKKELTQVLAVIIAWLESLQG